MTPVKKVSAVVTKNKVESSSSSDESESEEEKVCCFHQYPMELSCCVRGFYIMFGVNVSHTMHLALLLQYLIVTGKLLTKM